MPRTSKIVIADRSDLAANMYKLLLAQFGALLIVRKRFEEIRPHFFRREHIDLAIINSNIFGKKTEEIVRTMTEEQHLRRVQKIFVCRDTEIEKEWSKRLAKIENSAVILRPFPPAELAALAGRLVETEDEKGG